MFSTSKRLIDLSKGYAFIRATTKDKNLLTGLCAAHFTRLEPHAKAVGLTESEARPIIKRTVDSCLRYPYTTKVVEKCSGDVVAIRLMSIGTRNIDLYKEVFDEHEDIEISEKMEKIGEILKKSKKIFWERVDVNKVLRREITFVLPSHQRKGIARRLVWDGLDVKELKAQGIQGMVSEATSLANQELLQSEGFQYILKPQYDWADKVESGSEGIKVLFKRF